MSLWDDITSWLYAPFQQQQNWINWILLVMLTATAAYIWARILDKVLEE